MKKEELKEIVCDKIDEQKEKIYAIGNQIYHHPELGYKEKQTSKLVSDLFDELRLSYEKQLAVTGIKAKLHDNKKGINIAIVSELDAVVCPNHKDSDSNSGAAHTCGHFAQIAAMLGCAIGLNEIKDQLDGNVSFIAAPAEECVEIEYRQSLIEKGVIHYLGGKQEMIHQHVFDDVDMAMLIHGMRVDDHIKATSFGTGFIAKTIYFKGKEAHAGLEPWKGINALSAANLAMQAIQYVKDSFDPLNCTRIHYFMSKGGTLVNIVPNDVRIEMYIRSSSIESIKEANSKVNQAIKGSAYALGCDVTIQDSPGYLPLISDLNLGEVFKQNAQMICPNTKVIKSEEIEGISTDMGDLSNCIPCIQAGIGGFINGFHTKDFKIDNEELAYLIPAKILACTIIDLLDNHASLAKEIKKQYHSSYTIQNYDQIWQDIIGK